MLSFFLSAVGLTVIGLVVFAIFVLIALNLRRIVPTNEVHIVQTSKATVSYGRGQQAGNSYYQWPSWIPSIGVSVRTLSTAVFSIELEDYPAYDKERVPFVVDVVAFFRVEEPNTAAQRVENTTELHEQLTAIVQGAVRTVLASEEIDTIMTERATFGEKFTHQVEEQLKNWGISSVKNIELMDIRDTEDTQVIHQIMQKRMSHIDMESRQAVAKNSREAQLAEIAAAQEVGIRKQEAEERVGLRTAEKEQTVGIANEQAAQQVKGQQKITKAAEMEVKQVELVRGAEIEKQVQIVAANRQKETSIINAEASKQTAIINAEAQKETAIRTGEGEKAKTVLAAEANRDSQTLNAEGIKAEGLARGEAEQAVLMAPVNAQIALADKIGSDKSYQQYLLGIRNIEAVEAVGKIQADALKGADIKVIANASDPSTGTRNIMDLFSANGGFKLGSMLDGLASSEAGKDLVNRVTGNNADADA